MTRVLIAGGGIAGLSAALACARAGCEVALFERASALEEVGAGIQLGPNAMRVLADWGVAEALEGSAVHPRQLKVRDAQSASVLATMALGERMRARYGHPYVTVHRADLQRALQVAVERENGVTCTLGQPVSGYETFSRSIRLLGPEGALAEGDVLLGCDGLWSKLAATLPRSGPPHAVGQIAYRALLPRGAWAGDEGTDEVNLWLAPGLHLVHYPVRSGQWLNVVAVVDGELPQSQGWDHAAGTEALSAALKSCAPLLRGLPQAAPDWRAWVVHEGQGAARAESYIGPRIALLGDAVHPMRPYLAQGAAMALEDAWTLGLLLRAGDVPGALQAYAAARWARNARVQGKARALSRVFHATGLLRRGRDLSLTLLGEHLLDSPWLYRGPHAP